MEQEELLEYLKDEMDFAHELWCDLDPHQKTLEFRSYLCVQITSTIFGQRADLETINIAKEYFDSLGFDVSQGLSQVG